MKPQLLLILLILTGCIGQDLSIPIPRDGVQDSNYNVDITYLAGDEVNTTISNKQGGDFNLDIR